MACTHMNGMNVLHHGWSFTYSGGFIPGWKKSFCSGCWSVGHKLFPTLYNGYCGRHAVWMWVGELLLEMSDRNCAHLLILLSVGDACPIIHCGQIQISFHQGMGSTILFFEWVDNTQEFIKQCGIYNLISPTMEEISVKHYTFLNHLFLESIYVTN